MAQEKQQETFIIDCPACKAKVAAVQEGIVRRTGEYQDPDGAPQGYFGYELYSGKCPHCRGILAGVSEQIQFSEEGGYDSWSDIVRVYPQPVKVFNSSRIPSVVRKSLAEGDRCLSGGSPTAACLMFGRALEAICQDQISKTAPTQGEIDEAKQKNNKPVEHGPMLGAGIATLNKRGVIEKRFLEWSKHLHAFRNMAAHPNEFIISDEDAADLQGFIHAFTEYVYDLADRYEDFMDRLAAAERKKKKAAGRSS